MWIKCTNSNDRPILVNLDTIVRIERGDANNTRMIVCAAVPGANKPELPHFLVRETLEDIERRMEVFEPK
jgi:hypothetical protein